MKRSSDDVLKTLSEKAARRAPRVAQALLLALSLAVGACSGQKETFLGSRYRIPWPDDQGTVAMRAVQIRTLTQPKAFEGTAAKIMVEPFDGGGRLKSEKAQGKFIRASNGLILPADYVTLQAITAYAHQERLQEFDHKAGVDAYLSWPLTVGVEVKVLDQGETVTNNAIYDGRLDALLIVPYQFSQLPIALNGGILAHEHFHFIFQKAILNLVKVNGTQMCRAGIAPATEQRPGDAPAPAGDSGLIDEAEARSQAADQIPFTVYNQFLLRGMNEGLADFWGWAYSNDSSFVGRSLPSEDRVRRLDLDPFRLRTDKSLRESLVDLERADKMLKEEYRVARAYALGTQYARFLRAMVENLKTAGGMSDQDAKLTVARALIASLPMLAEQSVKAYSTEYLSSNILLKPLMLNLPSVSDAACATLENFHAAEASYVKPRACQAVAPAPVPPAVPAAVPSKATSPDTVTAVKESSVPLKPEAGGK